MRRISIITTILFLLSACGLAPTPEPTETSLPPLVLLQADNPYAPKVEDPNLTVAGLMITSTSLIERFDLEPFRVELIIAGSMPSVCNELRLEIDQPNIDHEVHIKAYSVSKPTVKCDNVFQQFEANVLLGVYSSGVYTVWINDGFVGNFTMY